MVGNLLMMWTTRPRAWAQKIWGNWAWYKIARVIPKMCWCFLSTHFVKGYQHNMFDAQCQIVCKNHWEWIHNHYQTWLVMLNWVLIIDTNDLMMDDASNFNLMRNNQVNLLLSSTIVRKYLYPIIDGVDKGPQYPYAPNQKQK